MSARRDHKRRRVRRERKVIEGVIDRVWIATGLSQTIGHGWHVGVIVTDDNGAHRFCLVSIPPAIVQHAGAQMGVRELAVDDDIERLTVEVDKAFAVLVGPHGLKTTAGLESVSLERRFADGDDEKRAKLFDGYPWSEIFGGVTAVAS